MNDLLFYGIPLLFAFYAIRARFLKTVYLLFAIIFGAYFGLYAWDIIASFLSILNDRMFVDYKKAITVSLTGFAVGFLLNRLFYNSMASRKLYNIPHGPDKVLGALAGWMAGSIALNFVIFVITMTPLADKITTFTPDVLSENSLKSMVRITRIMNFASFQKFDSEKCEKYLITLRPAPPEPTPETDANGKPVKPGTTKPGTTTPGTTTTTTKPTTTTTTVQPTTTTTTTTTTVQPTPRDAEIKLKTQTVNTDIKLNIQPKTKVDIKL